MTQEIAIIVAIESKHGIGFKNNIPWYISNDFKKFKSKTINNIVIMGRKTWESLPRIQLPSRINIVITRYNYIDSKDLYFVKSFDRALELSKEFDKSIYLIGGTRIFSLGLNVVDRIYVTRINEHYLCDTFFPTIPQDRFMLTNRSPLIIDKKISYYNEIYDSIS